MTEVRIDTARGIRLAGTLTLPEGAAPLDVETLQELVSHGAAVPVRSEAAILLAHSFLTDRHGVAGRLDRLAEHYRGQGFATLQFDFSGLGCSDDDVITLAGEVEDLQAAASWLAGLGYARLGVHANGLGATAALLARPESVRTAVLVGAIVGPQSILWEEIFSPEQLDELAQHGLTRLVDDNPNSREWNVLSKETLADFSMQDPQRTLADLPWPVLMVHGVLSNELPDTAEATAEGFPLLPDSSQMVHVHAETLDQAQEEVARLSLEWAQRRLR